MSDRKRRQRARRQTPDTLPPVDDVVDDVEAYLWELGARMLTTTVGGEFSAISYELGALCAVLAAVTTGEDSRMWGERVADVSRAAQPRCPAQEYRRNAAMHTTALFLGAGGGCHEDEEVRLAAVDVVSAWCAGHAAIRDLPRSNDGWAVSDHAEEGHEVAPG